MSRNILDARSLFVFGADNSLRAGDGLARCEGVPLIAAHRPAPRYWSRSPRSPQSEIPRPPPIYTPRNCPTAPSLRLRLRLRLRSPLPVCFHRRSPRSRIQPSPSLRAEGKMMDEMEKTISDKKLYAQMRLWEFTDRYIFEPLDTISDSYLSISRADGSMTLIGELPQCGNMQSPKVRLVFGLIGTLRLIVGVYLFVITSRECVGTYLGHSIYKISSLEILPCNLSLDSSSIEQKKVEAEFSTLLNAAEKTYGLYFSYDVNLTLCAQRLHELGDESKLLPLWRQADPRFLWNGYMLEALIDNKLDPYLLPVMQGSYQHFEAAVGTNIVNVSLIARRCTRRTGTRMWRRGADLDGYVANFVETEQILQINGLTASFLQVRGSIPLLWEQIVDLTYKPPFQIVQPDEGPRVAQRHFLDLVKRYSSVIAVDLVNTHGGEGRLSERFAQAMETITNDNIRYVHFDFHAICGHIHFERLSLLYDQIEDFLKKHSYFLLDVKGGKVKEQTGVVRTNCIDCLDRTNVTQSMIGRKMLEIQLNQIGIFGDDDAIIAYSFFDTCFKTMWANHGDDISIQYSGTTALKGDFVRFGKRTIEGIVKDGINSLVRYYLNNFTDGIKQDATDLLQGHYILSTTRGLASPTQSIGLEAFASMKVASGVILAGVLFAMLSLRQVRYDLRYLLYALFWGGLSMGAASIVKANGRMFTNRPRLNLRH